MLELISMQLGRQMAWYNPLKGVERTHTYDKQRVSVVQEFCSAEAERGTDGRLVEVGVGFPGMGFFLGFEWGDSDHSPEGCEADTESGERYCLAVAGLGGKLAAGIHHLHTN